MSAGGGRPLRVLCVSNMHPGPDAPDLGVFVADMCERLRRRGARVEVAAITTRRRGPLRTPAKYLGLLLRAAPGARRAEVLYAHGIFPAGLVAAAWGRLLGRPWVVTAHGQDVANLGIGAVRRLSAPALSGASAVVAVSGRLAAELRGSGLRLPRLHVLNMGVDLERFRPSDRAAARRALGLPRGGAIVLAAGSLIPRKNPLGLVRALAALPEGAPAPLLVWLGSGPLREAMLAEARALGLGERVMHVPAVTHAAVPSWMAAADLLALPSLAEPLGQVALEALACGRPVLAGRGTGTAEVVPDGAGAIVDPREPEAIAAGLAALLARPPDEARCRAAAAAHGLDRQAAEVERILRAAAGRR